LAQAVPELPQVPQELVVKVFSSMPLLWQGAEAAAVPVPVIPWALVELLSEMAAETAGQEATEILRPPERAVVAVPVVTPEREAEGVTLVPLRPLRMA
jgi:hypothetical protein